MTKFLRQWRYKAMRLRSQYGRPVAVPEKIENLLLDDNSPRDIAAVARMFEEEIEGLNEKEVRIVYEHMKYYGSTAEMGVLRFLFARRWAGEQFFLDGLKDPWALEGILRSDRLLEWKWLVEARYMEDDYEMFACGQVEHEVKSIQALTSAGARWSGDVLKKAERKARIFARLARRGALDVIPFSSLAFPLSPEVMEDVLGAFREAPADCVIDGVAMAQVIGCLSASWDLKLAQVVRDRVNLACLRDIVIEFDGPPMTQRLLGRKDVLEAIGIDEMELLEKVWGWHEVPLLLEVCRTAPELAGVSVARFLAQKTELGPYNRDGILEAISVLDEDVEMRPAVMAKLLASGNDVVKRYVFRNMRQKKNNGREGICAS